MKILKNKAIVGFEETNDALVTVSPQVPGQGITIELISPVIKQYGEHLEALILETIKTADYTDVHVKVLDKGAWDYTLQARVLAALNRGAEG